jgi:DNA-binding NarL/FixJ family response regulator
MMGKNMNKIMVVEDEAVIAIRLQERLTAMGYHVVGISYSGEDAMEQARRLRPDLILMDIMIPGEMDGIAVAKLVKTELDIPVIFLTAFSEDKIIDRAKQAEPYGYIVKPFQDRELKACVEIALYKKEMGKALQEAHNELELRVKERTRDLEIKTKSLEEMNIAMKILLKKREEDKIELEDNVLTNVKELVMPFVDKFRKTQLDEQQKTFLSIIESNLNEIISPFTRRLSLEYLRLTPSEIQIANMTKHGNTSKKIAKIMNISPRTVDTHKKNIRRKIGLEGKRANLRSYLLSLH